MPDTELDDLLTRVRACTLCRDHLPPGVRPVLQMDARARILIVGQAPGARANASSVPFDDASGERLRDWLGVERGVFHDARRIAILPMGFCYPGRAGGADLPPRPECARTWRAPLLARLQHVQLTVLLGRHALAHACGQRAPSVTDTVRDWRAHHPAVMPLPHPSPRNNRWLARNPWFEQDLLPALRARVAEVLGNGRG